MSEKLSLIETIKHEDKWSTFSRLLESSGAVEWLKRDGEFTVFAPTNDAFGKIPDAKMTELLNEPEQATLKAILSCHIVSGLHASASLNADAPRITLTGDEMTFSNTNGLKVNGAGVQARNIQATNGIIHQLDTVLMPSAKNTVRTTGPLEAAKTVSAAPVTAKLDPLPVERPFIKKVGSIH